MIINSVFAKKPSTLHATLLITHAGTAMSLKFEVVYYYYYFYYFLGGRPSDWLVVIMCGQSYSWQMT